MSGLKFAQLGIASSLQLGAVRRGSRGSIALCSVLRAKGPSMDTAPADGWIWPAAPVVDGDSDAAYPMSVLGTQESSQAGAREGCERWVTPLLQEGECVGRCRARRMGSSTLTALGMNVCLQGVRGIEGFETGGSSRDEERGRRIDGGVPRRVSGASACLPRTGE